MSELIDQFTANPGGDTTYLVQALVKTGPIIHEGHTFSGSITAGRHDFQKTTKSVVGARLSTAVDVPEGSYAGVDADQDAFRGRAVALKAGAGRILDLIDGALDTTAGKGGVAGILTTLKVHPVNAEGHTIDGIQALNSAIRTAQEAAAELAAILAQQGESCVTPA